MLEITNFESIKIGLASSDQIRKWSHGEVKKPETINYRTLKPERDGLFCERIFGPIKDWECHCGKYKRIRFKGIICDKCGVEVTRSKVRRERMGHIELATAVTHIWFFKGVPSRIGLLLDISPKNLEKVIYFASYIVLDPGNTDLNKNQLLSEMEYREYKNKPESNFKVGIGAEAINVLLGEIKLTELSLSLKEDIKNTSGQKRTKTIKRLEVVEAFRLSGNKPEWMVLEVLPVIPPELRPMVQLDGGRFATSDLNDLYRRVINRNNRLKRLLELGAPQIIVKNEKRMLQEAVDALIDNGRRGRPVTGPNNRPLKSLSDMLKGKQGRFRQNLLGKRVDYSARSVIVVGPKLKLHQCGLPKDMALELFKPFVMKKLVDRGLVHNIKSAKKMVERVRSEVWDVLEEVIKDHPVLLNRAPTLHRLGIQAFEPVLIEGKAIQVHPLVCAPYNADFDGDQMAVHLPLSVGAQAECKLLMLSSNNLLLPAYGTPSMAPTQDMVLGIYYLTVEKEGLKGEGKIFADIIDAESAFNHKIIELQAKIKIRIKGQLVETTLGRAIFNRVVSEHVDLEYMNEVVGKHACVRLVAESFRKFKGAKTAKLLDALKELGFTYATYSGTTIGIDDLIIPPEKENILKVADAEVVKIENFYEEGLLTDDEMYHLVTDVWRKATNDVAEAMVKNFDKLNPIFMMATSGARGNIAQVKQLAGMRGLMADPSGKIIPLPIKANLREGLSVLEYFISTHGARKGLADTALRTADSGYLTRRLVDVTQDVIIREIDCGTSEYLEVDSIREEREDVVPLEERITGRISARKIMTKNGDRVIVEKGQEIDEVLAKEIITEGYEKVAVRSVLSCESRLGVCAMCYGRDLATGSLVEVGETVGIIAAQSIGEPGTQLTLRTFHTGGVAVEDIITGLPRVEELFEARKPKHCAAIAEIDGIVQFGEEKGYRVITIKGTGKNLPEWSVAVPYNALVIVREGDHVEPGMQLTEGSLNPHDILRIKGPMDVQTYFIGEVQKVYRAQGVDISDKHIEVIVHQMLKKVRVEDSGETELLIGTLSDKMTFNEINQRAIDLGLAPATAKPALLGVTKASLATESFLSAASFQETTRVLTDAAMKGKSDPLLGLKENVIIGKLIPAGTGMARYRRICITSDDMDLELEKTEDAISQDEKTDVIEDKIEETITY